MAAVRLLYFAWVREKIGRGEDTLEIPADVKSVRDLVAWLSLRGDEYAAAFAQPETLRAAIDQQHVDHAALVSGAREIAFFPPVTGG
ncbi:MAG TPA: molybdopterin converting factor subunit 1 [Hyphomicrobiaceae bacterium]|nr:molybdopterin converting factor subunit 1 [Hyphomicrobiaceae bacterium]